MVPGSSACLRVTREILGSAVKHVTFHPSIGPRIKGKWITADIIISAIKALAVLDNEMEVNPRLLNILLPKIPQFKNLDRFDGTNMSGLFWIVHSKQKYYMFVEKGEQVEYPMFETTWKARTSALMETILFCSTKSNSIPVTKLADNCHQKRKATDNSTDKSSIGHTSEDTPYLQSTSTSTRQQLVVNTFWNLPEAI